MKSILLASASIVAFAGAAAAQDDTPRITFGGDAALGFNDATAGDADGDTEDSGFFYEANLAVTFRTTLNNGLVAESSFTIPIADNNLSNSLSVDNDFVLGLSIDGLGSLQLGDVSFGAEEFSFATMQSADFSEQDSETVLRGASAFANFDVVASALIQDEDGDEPGVRDSGDADDVEEYVDQISIGGNGDIGRFTLSFGYQDESNIIGGEDDPLTPEVDEGDSIEGRFDTTNGDFNPDEQYAIAVGTNFAGITALVGYGENVTDDTTSYGVQLSYAFGPVEVTGEYVIEDDFDENSFNIAAVYESGNIRVEAEYGEEVGEEEYDIKAAYAFSEVTNVQAGYNDDDGSFIALRQGIGAGAFVEASYSETDDTGFDIEDFAGGEDLPDDIRSGATLRVGLEF